MSESDVDTLRRAIAEIRSRKWGVPHASRGVFHLALVDWLDKAAEHDDTPCPAVDAALDVARTYLGERP